MSQYTTHGLSSPYQVTQNTATTELGQSSPDTGGSFTVQVQQIIDEKELARLADNEFIPIRIPPQHAHMAFYLLSKVCQFQSLPDDMYMLRRSDLRFLEEVGIPYEKVR